MRKFHAENERIKRKYFIFLKEAKRQDDASVDAAAKAISRFESYLKWRDFKAFHFEQAIRFKKHLCECLNEQTGKPLSKATMNSTLRCLKAFFQWLAMQGGYKSRINYTDTEYFNLSEKDTRIATAKRNRPVPTLEQIRYVIESMPAQTDIQKRNRAIVAFAILTGARVSAIASLKLKHINLNTCTVFQDAREVKTKASKTFITDFFPVGDGICQIVEDWMNYLRNELLFGNDDPVFPKTEVKRGKLGVFESVGVLKEHWSNSNPVKMVFKEAFELAGIMYFNPHSFRKTLGQLGEKMCQTPEEFKAWSQSMGHEGVLTTFYSYGEVQQSRQSDIFKALRNPRIDVKNDHVDQIAKAVAKELRRCPEGQDV